MRVISAPTQINFIISDWAHPVGTQVGNRLDKLPRPLQVYVCHGIRLCDDGKQIACYLSILITHNATCKRREISKFWNRHQKDRPEKIPWQISRSQKFLTHKKPGNTHKPVSALLEPLTLSSANCCGYFSSLPEEVKWWGELAVGLEWFLPSLCLCLNNQRSYGQTDGTGGFRASNRSRNTPPQNSDDSCELLHRRWRSVGGIFHLYKLEMFSLVAQQPGVLW